jgi:hypothetical protein
MRAWGRCERRKHTIRRSHAYVTAQSCVKPPSPQSTILVQHTIVHYTSARLERTQSSHGLVARPDGWGLGAAHGDPCPRLVIQGH